MAAPVEVVRIVAGSLFVLVVPGLVWSFLFFPRSKPVDAPPETEGVDWLERTALAFGLSIALVPITVFVLNYFLRVPLTTLSAILIVLAITAAPTPWIWRRQPDVLRRLRGHGKAPPGPVAGAPRVGESEARPIQRGRPKPEKAGQPSGVAAPLPDAEDHGDDDGREKGQEPEHE